MPKSVITGGAGFIGSHLAEALLQQGHQVTVIDNFSTGRPENIAPFLNHPAFNFVLGDINDTTVAPAFRGADYVFHLAALADIVPSIQQPMNYHRANVDGTMHVMEMVRAEAPALKKFIYPKTLNALKIEVSEIENIAIYGAASLYYNSLIKNNL